MLTKDKRLRKGQAIALVYKKGRYASAGSISLKALQTRYPSSRVVVVVGKKVSKKATTRNKLRRRVVAVVEQEWQTVKPGYDIVITVHEDLQSVAPPKLQAELRTLLKKADLVNV